MSNLEPFNWTVVILYDIATSEPVAFMHESYVSGISVGATAGAAVAEIAGEDAPISLPCLARVARLPRTWRQSVPSVRSSG